MLGLKLIHASKRGHKSRFLFNILVNSEIIQNQENTSLIYKADAQVEKYRSSAEHM